MNSTKYSHSTLRHSSLKHKNTDENPFGFEDANEIIYSEHHFEEGKNEGDNIEPKIRAATLVKLIEIITEDHEKENGTLVDFLLVYPSFTTPQDLVDLLIKRFHTPNRQELSEEEWNQKQHQIRKGVVAIFEKWLEMQEEGSDMLPDDLRSKLTQFMDQDLVPAGFKEVPARFANILKTRPSHSRQSSGPEAAPKPILPKKFEKISSVNSLKFLELSSEEIARQMAIIEFNLFRNIKPREFFNQAWTKKNKQTAAPNILKLMKHFNRFVSWIVTEIVQVDSVRPRASVLTKFIEIAEECKKLNNLNGLLEVLSAIDNCAIHRLRNTWDNVPQKSKESYENMKKEVFMNRNWLKLRQILRTSKPPLIPYIGIFLGDLIYIDDGGPDFFEGTLVNWTKRQRLASVMRMILKFQGQPYNFEPVQLIQDMLLNSPYLSEELSYAESLKRESSSGPTKKKSFWQKKTKSQTLAEDGRTESEDIDDYELEYLPGYKFYEKDTQSNIIIETYGETTRIIAGTIPKLVERLAYEKHPDHDYVFAFLTTFRSFLTPLELLNLLIMRYNIPSPVSHEEQIQKLFDQRKKQPIQLRVLNVIKLWIESYFEEDFKGNEELDNKLIWFLDSTGDKKMAVKGMKDLLASKKNKAMETPEQRKASRIFKEKPPKPILPEKESLELLDIDPLELARQFALIDYENFLNIKPLELLRFSRSSRWNMTEEDIEQENRDNAKRAPNVVSMINRFVDVMDWVATEIMARSTNEERSKVIDFLLDTAQHCLELQNFHTLTAIVGGLTLDFILALKSSWKPIEKEKIEKFKELVRMVHLGSNSQLLREKMETIVPPAIPYLDVYLDDLSIIRSRMPDTVADPKSLINFSKQQRIAAVVKKFSNLQQDPYCLTEIEPIQRFLKKLPLKIKSLTELAELSKEYQQIDGDNKITEEVISRAEFLVRSNSGNAETAKRASLSSKESTSSYDKNSSIRVRVTRSRRNTREFPTEPTDDVDIEEETS